MAIYPDKKKHPNPHKYVIYKKHTDCLAQDCSNSSALAMELLQSCTKSSIYMY